MLAIGSIVALFVLDGRLGNVNSEVATRVDKLERTISATSASVASAASSASGFSTTLGTTATALESASGVTGELSPVVVAVGKLAPVLGSAGDRIDAVGRNLSDLAPTLATMSTNLRQNQQELAKTSATATRLANELENVQSFLEKGTIETRVDEGLGFLKAVLIAMTIWLALPAMAALFIGIWLRRAVSPQRAPAA